MTQGLSNPPAREDGKARGRFLTARMWNGWKRLARRAATLQARFLLTVFYGVVLAPVAMLARPFADPLRRSRGHGGRWTPCAPVDSRRQH